jgi:hypothetical protein
MFQTVRHWWSGGRGKVTLRLFMFEFVVVVAGVLVAQGLADWVRARGDRDEGNQLVARVELLALDLNKIANYWQKHGPCLRDHVGNIARDAVAGRPLTMQEIGRPGLPGASSINLGEDDWRKIESVVGRERSEALGEFSINRENVTRYSADISDQWAALKLLDRSIGEPSPEDRARVRLATAIIDNRLRWLIYNGGQSRDQMEKAGFRRTSRLPQSEKRVDRCGLIKDWV